MKTAIYVRLSQNREDDVRKPQRQLDACSSFLQREGVDTWIVYMDDDRSAYKGRRRPDWDRLMTDIKSGRIKRVVSLHVDRLLRSMSQLEGLIDLVESTGCLIHTVESGHLDLTTSAGRQTARLLATMATGESERKSERHRSKAAQLRGEGRSTGGARPFGWVSPNGPLNSTEAELIREATTVILNGGTLYGINKRWNEAGITTTFGRPWSSNKQVARILMRWRNAGLVEHNDQVVGLAVWPRIVTEDEVAAVRTILRDPGRKTTPGPTPRWLLSGIALCGRCSSPLRLGLQTQNRGKSYRCSGDRCYLAIPAATADQAVVDWVAEHLAQPPSLITPNDEILARRRQLTADLAQVAADEKALAESQIGFTSKLALAEQLQRTRTLLQEELQDLSAHEGLSMLLEDVLPYSPRFGATMGDVLANEAAVKARFASLTLEQKRLLLRSLIEVRVTPGTQGRSRLSPIDRVNITPKT